MLVFVALCINQFARRSTEAGSMYGYVADHLGPALGAVGGWALLWAYGFVATAVLGAMALFIERLAIRASAADARRDRPCRHRLAVGISRRSNLCNRDARARSDFGNDHS